MSYYDGDSMSVASLEESALKVFIGLLLAGGFFGVLGAAFQKRNR